MKSPGALTVISSSQCTSVCHHQDCIMLYTFYVNLWEFASGHLRVLGIIRVLYVVVVVLMKPASYDHVYAVIASSLGG